MGVLPLEPPRKFPGELPTSGSAGSELDFTDAQAFERNHVHLLLKRDADCSDIVVAFGFAQASGLKLGSETERIVGRVAKHLAESAVLQSRVARRRAQAAARRMPDFASGDKCLYKRIFVPAEARVVERVAVPKGGAKPLSSRWPPPDPYVKEAVAFSKSRLRRARVSPQRGNHAFAT